MIPTSANHISRLLPRRLKGDVFLLDFLCVRVSIIHSHLTLVWFRTQLSRVLKDTLKYTLLWSNLGDPRYGVFIVKMAVLVLFTPILSNSQCRDRERRPRL